MISKQKLINKLRAEGSKLFNEGDKLRAEADKLYAEGYKLYAEADKLHAEGCKLCAESNKLYAEANILEKMSKWDWIRICIRCCLLEMFHPFATHKQHEDRANRAADKFMERKFGKNWRNE